MLLDAQRMSEPDRLTIFMRKGVEANVHIESAVLGVHGAEVVVSDGRGRARGRAGGAEREKERVREREK